MYTMVSYTLIYIICIYTMYIYYILYSIYYIIVYIIYTYIYIYILLNFQNSGLFHELAIVNYLYRNVY